MDSMQSERFTVTYIEEILAGDPAMTELSDADLDECAGGLSLGDFSSLMDGSSSFFGQERLSLGQATFAGPNGSGTISTLDFERTISGTNRFTSLGK
jgi:hypothetical protein